MRHVKIQEPPHQGTLRFPHSAMALGKLFKDGQGNVSAAPEELFEHAQLRTVRLAQHPAKDVQECRHCAHAPQSAGMIRGVQSAARLAASDRASSLAPLPL